MYSADEAKNKLKKLYEDFNDSVLYSYFEGIFGDGYCDDISEPQCAVIHSGDFYFLAGDHNNDMFCNDAAELIGKNRSAVVVPDDVSWFEKLNFYLENKLETVKRFHTHLCDKGPDKQMLKKKADRINDFPKLSLKRIDKHFYNAALTEKWSECFVSNFKNYDDYSANGFGYIITDSERIISGASSYSYYSRGVEVELATHEDYRQQGFAQIVSAAFLLECLERGLVPHWDARNKISLKIAESSGFVFSDEYTAFEFKEQN